MLSAAFVAFTLISPRGLGAADQSDWQDVQIVATEYRFVPETVVLSSAKPIRIEIVNRGNEQHEFRSNILTGGLFDVELGDGVVRGRDIHSVIVHDKRSAVIKIIQPKPGRYDFECRIPSHHGMDGVIEIR